MAALEIYCGDTRRVNLTFTNDDGTPLNLSGYSVLYYAAQNYDIPPIITKVITGHDVPVSGMTHMDLTTGDTTQCPGNYLAQFKLEDPSSGISTFNTDGLTLLPSLPSVQ